MLFRVGDWTSSYHCSVFNQFTSYSKKILQVGTHIENLFQESIQKRYQTWHCNKRWRINNLFQPSEKSVCFTRQKAGNTVSLYTVWKIIAEGGKKIEMILQRHREKKDGPTVRPLCSRSISISCVVWWIAVR